MIKKLRALLLVVVLTMSLLHFPSVAEDTNDILLNGTVKSYAQNSLQAAKRSVVMQWRDR